MTEKNEIDLRIKNLSYSSSLLFHTCPRKYQLYKLNGEATDTDLDSMQSVTFAFGHAVGSGIQDILRGKNIQETIWNMFLAWPIDLALIDTKRKKSYYLAVAAIKTFNVYFNSTGSVLSQYELVYFSHPITKGRTPALELPFIIELPDGFKFRGMVDAVLRHKVSREILVLEIKTTGAKYLHEAMYKNSAQAIGYSVVLDSLFPGYSSYKVFYMPYKTSSMEFDLYSFSKSLYQRAAWLQDLLLDIEIIKMYEKEGIYPMRGESCFNYMKACEYMDICTLSTERITKPLSVELEEEIEKSNEKYYIKLSILDLIETQLNAESTANEFDSESYNIIDLNELKQDGLESI